MVTVSLLRASFLFLVLPGDSSTTEDVLVLLPHLLTLLSILTLLLEPVHKLFEGFSTGIKFTLHQEVYYLARLNVRVLLSNHIIYVQLEIYTKCNLICCPTSYVSPATPTYAA